MENKTYDVLVYLEVPDIRVRAKNGTEAKKKAYAKLAKMAASKYIQKSETRLIELF